jgi:hypothetical protein
MQKSILPCLVLGNVIKQLLEVQSIPTSSHLQASLSPSNCIHIIPSSHIVVPPPRLRAVQYQLQPGAHLGLGDTQPFQPPRSRIDPSCGDAFRPAFLLDNVVGVNDHKPVHEDAVHDGQSRSRLLLVHAMLLLQCFDGGELAGAQLDLNGMVASTGNLDGAICLHCRAKV